MFNILLFFRQKIWRSHGLKIWLATITGTCIVLLNGCQSEIVNITNINSATGEQIIVLGDSITAGYGLPAQQAYPFLLSQKINLPIVNRGVSGDTTADALARLSRDVLTEKPWMVIIGLGGNDFLKKVPKTLTEQNLRAIISQIQTENAITVLLGMNLGLFTDEYKDLYHNVAESTGSYLIPQVLKGIIDNPQHRQQDIIHPNAIGQEILAEKIARALKPVLEEATFPAVLSKKSGWNE
ncbi:lysophospholipase L1-like esterase [Xenococcus sp. PCC 7305]|uniref:arylesterase n=1 Tax=Xenococcus sp. PCC 7305 TaxID=102125 RepID=UPI0002AC403B|nr:arylesterase [Xenococcus sp. PCC 7305]ELS05365.1 lysophospholipase L1-like esterase [Xenococcus sp. PCC 7305]